MLTMRQDSRQHPQASGTKSVRIEGNLHDGIAPLSPDPPGEMSMGLCKMSEIIISPNGSEVPVSREIPRSMPEINGFVAFFIFHVKHSLLGGN